MADLPEPISREDKLLHNIADKTPNIDDLVPISREEKYLKYIAMNGTAGGSGSGESVKVVQETGTSTTSVMSQNAVSEEFKKLGTNEVTSVNGKKGNVVVTADDVDTYTKSQIDSKMPAIVQTTGTLTDFVMSQNAVTNALDLKVDKIEGKGLSTEDFTTADKEKLENTVINNATNEESMALGIGSSVPGSITIDGEHDIAQSIAIGYNSRVLRPDDEKFLSSWGSIAIGVNSTAANDEGNVAIGTGSNVDGSGSIAIGHHAAVTGINDNHIVDSDIAIGLLSKASNVDSVALGANAKATGKSSVAIGCYSAAEEENVVSVGSLSYTRRIVNLTDPQNPQDAATKNYVDTRINPTILYSNDSGTTETITLSQPYTDFSRIGVYALGQYDAAMDSTYGEIYTSLEYMTLACVSGEKDADGAYNCTVWRTAKIKFSENTITFVTNCASSFVKGDVGYKIGTEDGLKITRVVGYK